MKTKFKLTNRILSLVLALVMVLGMLSMTSFTALAADTSGDSVTIDLSTVAQDILLGENHTYSLDGGATYTEYVGNLTFTGTTAYSIIINSYAGIHDIVLDNVSMSNNTRNKGNILVSEAASLNLTLEGTNTLEQTGGNLTNSSPAINFLPGAKLTITEESTGILNVKGGYYCAAIGGTYCFTVEINGGTINAGYRFYGGGIGYGYTSSDSSPTTIIINNAVVNASGKGRFAAIGGGHESSGGASVNIVITDSIVTAVSDGDVAAIGAGMNDNNTYNITIKNSVINAETSGLAAAIGNSGTGTAGDIKIIDSVVTATSAVQKAAGIGGGPRNNVGNILIQNSTVTATGGRWAAGIGGGYANTVSENDKVIIIGSNVYASGDRGVRTIGAGEEGAGFPIRNADGSNIALTKITLQGVSRDVKVTKISTATGYEDVDIMTIGGVLYIWLPDGESPTEIIASGQKYIGTVTDKVGTFVFEHTCNVGENGTPASCGKYAVCGLCNQDFGEMLSHEYVYSATDNNVVTETCRNNCGYNETATLTAADATYTGSPITGASVSYSDGWQGEKKQPAADDYSNNVNAGTATVTTTVEGKELTTTFKINPANIADAEIVLSAESGCYNGSEQKPDVIVKWNGSSLTANTDYTLSWNPADLTNAGAYTVRIAGIGNFTGSVEKSFTIYVAYLGDVMVEQVGTLTYNGEAQKPTVSASAIAVNDQPITFTYSTIENGTYGSMPSFTEAGTYTVYYKATAPNHIEAKGSFTVTVNKAIVTEPTIASKVYNGSVQTADIADTDLYTVVENNGGTGVLENGKGYNVVLKLTDPENYKWSSTDEAEVTLSFKITRATNEWEQTPSIEGWTYGEIAKVPVGTAKFGDVSVEYSGTANDGTSYISTDAPTKAGSYKATFIVAETENYSGLETPVDFTIEKADQAAPTGLTKTDTTYFGKADGKISDLTSAMEFRKEGDSIYTAGFNGTLEHLAAGTYYVRYLGDANHNPSPDTAIIVGEGRKLQIVVPQNQVGYTVTVNKTEMEYEGSYTLKVEIHEGYTATEDFKIIISNWESGQQAGVEETYMNAIADQIIEVQGVADITEPTAEIKIENNKWTSFWNNLTFGLFFKETQDVTITATDTGSGVKSVQYYLSDRELKRDEVRAITDWQTYNGTFKVNPDNQYVIYVKVADNSGNTVYLNSARIVLDATAPELIGIENNGIYYGDKVFKALDDNFLKIEVDGVDITDTTEGDDEFEIKADNKEHTVTVTDKAGNVTEYKVTVYKNYTVTYKADGNDVDTVTVGHGKDANLPAVPHKDGCVGKWDSDGKNITEDTTISVVYTEIPVVKPDEVKPEDKTDLEDAKKQLEEMLEEDSYTDDDKKDIQDAIDDIDDALEVIGNVEAVEELIDKLPDTIKKDDEAAIKAADDAYNALTDYEKSLVDKDAKKALDDAKAALAELNKPNPPVTGDNSHMMLWIALLFISGGAVITLTVVDRKRRTAKR